MVAGPAMQLISEEDDGTGAIAVTLTAGTDPVVVTDVQVNFTVAPVSNEDLTITLTRVAGGVYNLYTVDPATEGATDVVYFPGGELWLETGDEIALAYANSDGRTFDAQITARQMPTN